MKTAKFARKPFIVDGVQVTEENMQEIAEWCGGEVRQTRGKRGPEPEGTSYVKVHVNHPLNERQTMAFLGDWVLGAGTGFKVYTNKAFKSTFDSYVEEDYEAVFKNPEDKDLKVFQEAVSGEHAIIQ